MLAGLFVATLLERALVRSADRSRHLLVLVEDTRALADRVDLAELLTVGEASGVSFVLCAPNTAAYGARATEVLSRCGTLIAVSGCSGPTARLMSERIAQRGNNLGMVEIARPPFAGRIATVDSRLVGDRPFLVDLSA